MKEKIINKNSINELFYKTNPSGGISLIVLVITIIVVVILAAAVIVSLQNNNPMAEANEARIKSDVANMQSIFTNTVGKIMAQNQDVVEIGAVQLNSVTSGKRKTTGETTYKILGTDGTPVVQGKIKFSTEKSEGTIYCTGRELPLYSSDTKWSVDNQGLLSVEVNGIMYGEGEKSDSENVEASMLKPGIIFYNSKYNNSIMKIKFVLNEKVPDNKIFSSDLSDAQDGSIMAWIQENEINSSYYTLIISSNNKIKANPNSAKLFYDFRNLSEIENIDLLDTSEVTTMNQMFRGCTNLENIDLSSLNTSKVTNMEAMFWECENLKNVNLNVLNTSKVTNISGIFSDCNSLTTIDLSGLDTRNVIDMSNIVRGCKKLISVDLSGLDTSNVIDMSHMFGSCEILENLNLSGLDTSKVRNMQGMFSGCKKITTLDLSNFNTSEVYNMNNMFNDCELLVNVDLSNFDTGKVNYMELMFRNCNNIKTTITIKNRATYNMMLSNAATTASSKITLNYTSDLSEFIDKVIDSKTEGSNVVKGVQI